MALQSEIVIFDEKLVEEKDYWIEKLSRELGETVLRPDYPRTPDSSSQRDTIEICLNDDVYAALMSLTNGGVFLVYTTLLAALKIYLYQQGGNPWVVVGSPARRLDEAGAEVGNVVAIVDELSGELSFRQVLMQVRESLLQAYSKQQYPFGRVVRDAGVQVAEGRCPVFDVVMALDSIHGAVPDLGQDVEIRWRLEGQQLRGEIKYQRRLYRRETMQRFAQQYEAVLRAGVSEAGRAVQDLAWYSEAERHQLLVEWNDTAVEWDAEGWRNVVELIEQQAALSPDAAALVMEDQVLSYRLLNERANQLAHYLRQKGVGPEVLVGICLERSLEWILGMLGIMKAGGAFVSLDPGYPQERLSWMLEDAQVPVILTQEALLDKLPVHWGQVISLDNDLDLDLICRQPVTAPRSGITAENAAYVIYTSGTTGQPKGVLVVHRGLYHMCRAQLSAFNARPGERLLQFAPTSFDASVFEVMLSLCAGATLCFASAELLLPGAPLLRFLREHDVNLVTLPPSALAAMPPVHLPELHTINVAGEACTARLVSQWSTDRVFNNLYGPTEATIWSTASRCTDDGVVPSIGRPIPNTQVFALDGRFRPVPIGVPGELCIGGLGVTRGYLNRPELTAEKFVPHAEGGRLYRTGDLGHFRSNGQIEYLERMDFQVKVRGFRIEVGEIETALRAYPGLEEVVVLAREDTPGDKRLVAYLVTSQKPAPTVSEWRRYLKERLPDYMIPAAFVVLEQLPRTSSGKVDRRKLPAPELMRPDLDEKYSAPESPVHQALADVWAEVLKLERIGIDDNYFDLGGDSIRSIQVAAKAQERNLNFKLQDLFSYPTIRELSTVVEVTESSNTADLTPFALITEADLQSLPASLDDAYPLTRMQAGMLFHSQYDPEQSAVYLYVFNYHLNLRWDEEAMTASVREMVEQHAILRTSFDLTNYSEPLQLVHRSVDLPLEVTDLRSLTGAEQQQELQRVLVHERGKHFDWQQPPLIRIRIFRRTEETIQFMIVCHHSILDGWSEAALLTELFQRYWHRLGEGEPPPPPPVVSFRDYVALEQQALKSEETRSFWTRHLRDASPLHLPRWPSESEPGVMRQKVRRGSIVAPEVTERLNELASVRGVLIKSVLLAAHLRVLSWLSGQSDVLTGLISHGRPESNGGDRILGLFLNTLPFRLSLPAGNWAQLIDATFEVEREMLPHRWYPMAEMQRVMGGQSLFEVAFNYTHFHVYEGLDQFKGRMKLLEEDLAGETNFTLMVDFNIYYPHNYITLGFTFDSTQLNRT
ncbi:MAG TPA: amino acid adenylation domain-containing protein, partial [Pyrinomonadaceae bacterium]